MGYEQATFRGVLALMEERCAFCKALTMGQSLLLVPEATTVDQETRNLLEEAKEEDLYISYAWRCGVPCNNNRNSDLHHWHQERISTALTGLRCPKILLNAILSLLKCLILLD